MGLAAPPLRLLELVIHNRLTARMQSRRRWPPAAPPSRLDLDVLILGEWGIHEGERPLAQRRVDESAIVNIVEDDGPPRAQLGGGRAQSPLLIGAQAR